MFFSIRHRRQGIAGLYGLPPMPPQLYTTNGGQLQPDHQWVRYYEVDTSHQLQQCPANAPYGCWMIGGYAWGQRPWYSDEFQPRGWVQPPLPPMFPHPVKAKPLVVKTAVTAPKKPTAPPYAPPKPLPQPSVVPNIKPPAVLKQPSQLPPTPAVPLPGDTSNTQVLPPDMTQPSTKRRSLFGVGSVVGVGLFVAIGLTLLRKPK
jgi:hypothetical protein